MKEREIVCVCNTCNKLQKKKLKDGFVNKYNNYDEQFYQFERKGNIHKTLYWEINYCTKTFTFDIG